MKFSSTILAAPLLLAAGAAAIASPDNIATRDVQYIAKAGDTGESIAQANNVDFNALAAANTFVDWNNLWIGTPLTIPAKMARRDNTPYIVVPGDTGITIAKAYGIEFSALAVANTFVDWNNLWIGTPLTIPASIGTDPAAHVSAMAGIAPQAASMLASAYSGLSATPSAAPSVATSAASSVAASAASSVASSAAASSAAASSGAPTAFASGI